MEYQIFQFFHAFAGRHWLADWLLIFLAQYLGYILLAVLIFLIFFKYRRHQRFYYLLLSLFSLLVARGIITEVIGFLYARARPFEALAFEPLVKNLTGSSAFPSGHAALFFALAVLIFFVHRSYFWYFLGGAFLIGISRIIVGLHWPTDILAGAVIGIIIVVISRKLLPSLEK